MNPLLHISTLCVSIIMSLLHIIMIITYYYVFETGQLADGQSQAELWHVPKGLLVLLRQQFPEL